MEGQRPADENSIRLSGYVYDVKNINIGGTRGVAQTAALLFPDGQHRILIYLNPDVRLALVEGLHVLVEGEYCGDHIRVLQISTLTERS